MQKKILYAVLNWGLGHATRSIPIINHLLAQGHELIIASDGGALQLLQREYPSLQFEETAGYDVVYASSSAQFNIKLATQIPKFIQAIKLEHEHCTQWCATYDIDYIISDNRYGFYHEEIPSAFVCHQLHLLYPDSFIAEKIINKSYQSYLKNFTQLWVPDLAPPNGISNKMAALAWKNVYYLGIDSRFEPLNEQKQYDYLAILSGPEPQRSLLEEKVLDQLSSIEGNHYLVRGTTNGGTLQQDERIKVADVLESDALNTVICQSKRLICRSGYTSVLDLLKLDANAILIPTPGQAEQEYLAKALAKKHWFEVQTQDHLDFEQVRNTQGPKLKFGYDHGIIQQFLSCSTS